MRSILVVLIIFSLSSCELATTITVPEEPTTAVIASVFSSDTTWRIAVGTTAPVLTEIMQPVHDLGLTLTDGNGQIIPLTEEMRWPPPEENVFNPWVPPGTRVFTSNQRPRPGLTYTINVTGSNVPPASATATAPNGVEVAYAKLDSPSTSVIYQGEAFVPVDFTFQDPPDQADYYLPYLRAMWEYRYYDPAQGDTVVGYSWQDYPLFKSLNSDQEFIESDNEVEDIPDDTFEGRRHSLRVYARLYGYGHSFGRLVSLRLYLRHAGEEHYRYLRSLTLHENSRYNPFAEPVQVFSNVEGGHGIFAGSTVTYWEFVK